MEGGWIDEHIERVRIYVGLEPGFRGPSANETLVRLLARALLLSPSPDLTTCKTYAPRTRPVWPHRHQVLDHCGQWRGSTP